jgi:adenine-specific DNA-methyltransferase
MAPTRGIELSWPGKRPVAPLAGTVDDLEMIERVEPPRHDLQAALPYPTTQSDWRNLLVRGDNLVAMGALAERLRGRVDLVYIDPPYATGLSYYSQTELGEGAGSLARRAYRDQTRDGMIGYLDAMHARLAAIHELLADHGKLFVHCDWRANSMIRLVLDEIFGPACFRNEIVWRRAPNLGRQAASKQLGRVFDSIYVYSKSPGAPFPGPVPRRRSEVPLDRKGKPKGTRWDDERALYFTTAPRGDYTDQSIAELRERGRIYDSPSGTVYVKYFLTRGDDGRWYKDQPVDALWDDFEVRPLRHRPKAETMGYDTQKPEGLLERILGWATLPGDLVVDVFSGSGTTAAVAERMGRRWVAVDRGNAAIEITRRRLLDIGRDHAITGFDIASIEAAERRHWAEGGDVDRVLAAFGAEPTEGRWGTRHGARIFVGPATRPVRDDDVATAVDRVNRGETLVVLGFAWDGSDPATLRREAAERDVRLELRTIPMDVVRQSSLRGGGARFARRAEIDLEVETNGAGTKICLRNLQCDDHGDLPWSEAVDAWMIDFAHQGVFSPSWRSYRSQRDRSLALESPPNDCAGSIRVKVITVYGDETTRTIRVSC